MGENGGGGVEGIAVLWKKVDEDGRDCCCAKDVVAGEPASCSCNLGVSFKSKA